MHLSLRSYLPSNIRLSHEDKYNLNVKVKTKTESKDLTHYFKSLIWHGIHAKDFEGLAFYSVEGKAERKSYAWHSGNCTLENRRIKEKNQKKKSQAN